MRTPYLMALSELDTAIKYAEKNGYTSGTSAILFPTPSDDLGFWYQNLVSSRDELRKLGPDDGQLTRTNTLMKLRETLMDKSGEGESITVPSGIYQTPYQRLYALWGLGSFFALVGIGCLFLYGLRQEERTLLHPFHSRPPMKR